MNLIVMTNRKYHTDSRRYLIRCAEACGGIGIHVFCWETIEITVRERVVERFPATHDLASAYSCIRALAGEGKSLVLTGLGGYSNDFALRAREFLPNSLFVYDVYDDLTYGANGPALSQRIRWDLQWRSFCDFIMIKEEGMRQRYPRSFIVGNASHLRPLVKTDGCDPRRLIYAGSIDDRVDFDWLDRLARQDVTLDIYGWFHFASPEVRSLTDTLLKRRKNVAYKGSFNDDELPEILGNYAAGVVPYKKHHRKTKHVNPNKAYHYLNAGLEVIASPIPQILRLKDYVHVSETGDDFACIIDHLPQSTRASAWPVEQHTWKKRLQELLKITAALATNRLRHSTGFEE